MLTDTKELTRELAKHKYLAQADWTWILSLFPGRASYTWTPEVLREVWVLPGGLFFSRNELLRQQEFN